MTKKLNSSWCVLTESKQIYECLWDCETYQWNQFNTMINSIMDILETWWHKLLVETRKYFVTCNVILHNLGSFNQWYYYYLMRKDMRNTCSFCMISISLGFHTKSMNLKWYRTRLARSFVQNVHWCTSIQSVIPTLHTDFKSILLVFYSVTH